MVDIFRGYNSLIQPVKNLSQTPIVVRIALQLVLLINVDEKDQIMHTNVWLTLVRTLFKIGKNSFIIGSRAGEIYAFKRLRNYVKCLYLIPTGKFRNFRSGKIFKCRGIPQIMVTSKKSEWLQIKSGFQTLSCSTMPMEITRFLSCAM